MALGPRNRHRIPPHPHRFPLTHTTPDPTTRKTPEQPIPQQIGNYNLPTPKTTPNNINISNINITYRSP
ncbi:hypothetical protein HUW46_08279 [Amycolatopsis sp. CA-230715]|nr:hypothetical protein HUW46_02542 [Amycolatopsis sp. CA-230715]QWF79968.1 hypothetical protein HUW46_03381 [Amycolatopsis sp. CA-230715]QWF79996.1 hypothetical protein HUW46_03410 [Amycolatopsis sp. CA-230715]QWF80875.1 hypothetical protein HUW46_04300 [Amycolatopsis sp. CA-230715]QWF81266.1 hypothetical protein HUW46_04696 [Amycolatopsis sp. CA-230715]